MTKSKLLCLVILECLGIYGTTINFKRKEVMNLKEGNGMYMREFGDKREKEEVM